MTSSIHRMGFIDTCVHAGLTKAAAAILYKVAAPTVLKDSRALLGLKSLYKLLRGERVAAGELPEIVANLSRTPKERLAELLGSNRRATNIVNWSRTIPTAEEIEAFRASGGAQEIIDRTLSNGLRNFEGSVGNKLPAERLDALRAIVSGGRPSVFPGRADAFLASIRTGGTHGAQWRAMAARGRLRRFLGGSNLNYFSKKIAPNMDLDELTDLLRLAKYNEGGTLRELNVLGDMGKLQTRLRKMMAMRELRSQQARRASTVFLRDQATAEQAAREAEAARAAAAARAPAGTTPQQPASQQPATPQQPASQQPASQQPASQQPAPAGGPSPNGGAPQSPAVDTPDPTPVQAPVQNGTAPESEPGLYANLLYRYPVRSTLGIAAAAGLPAYWLGRSVDDD